MTASKPSETEKECAACEKVRGLTLSEEAWEVAVLNNHHALYQVAQLGIAIANAALSEKDARIAELETLNASYADERDSARASLRSASAANARLSQERDETRAALRDLVYQSEWFESCAEEGSDAWKAYAEARRVLGEGKP